MLRFVDFGETFIFIALVFASIVAVAVIIERSLVFRKNTNRDSKIFLAELSKKLRAHKTVDVAKIVDCTADNAYCRFASFALEHYREGHTGLADLMDGRIIHEKIELEKRLSILNTLGNNAPFIGLLGTVLGVIKAFHGLGTLGESGAEVVMRSISSALMATAAGLFVAIPVVMANNYFVRKVKIILENLNILSKEFLASYNHSRTKSKAE
jgi:biopolymer transport protein ExbB